MPTFHALIPAAGNGSRFAANLPKQYLPLLGQSMLWHSVRAMTQDVRIDNVFIVLAPEDEVYATIDWSGLGDAAARISPLYCGGSSRQDSVLNGLIAMASVVEPDDWILVHDAARPCLSGAILTRLINVLGADRVGGLLAIPVTDTLKSADETDRIYSTVPRVNLWQAQTPQMFRYDMLLHALNEVEDVTDEAGAIEALGLHPRLVAGDATNFKVTYPSDLRIAELLLKDAAE